MTIENELKERVRHFVRKYMDVYLDAETIIVDYALQTWKPLPNEVMYLQFVGNPGTGKTRAGEIMAAICHNPLKATGNTSPGTLMHLMHQKRPCTLILDEAYLHNDPQSTIAKILNSGAVDGNRIFKMVQKDEQLLPEGLDVFGYKVLISTSSFFDPAIQSRCLTIKMTGTNRNEIPRSLGEEFKKDSADIRQALMEFFSVKTREEVEALKANWLKDPCWDIEDTEGFGEYRGELLEFAKEQEDKWQAERESVDFFDVLKNYEFCQAVNSRCLVEATLLLAEQVKRVGDLLAEKIEEDVSSASQDFIIRLNSIK